MKPRILPRFEDQDSAEVDALKDLERSPGYNLVVERVKSEIERLGRELEAPADMEQTAQLRGEIRAYRTILRISTILKAEIERK